MIYLEPELISFTDIALSQNVKICQPILKHAIKKLIIIIPMITQILYRIRSDNLEVFYKS